MAKSASGAKSRNVLTTANKYQASIIILTFFPSILMFFIFVCIVFITNPSISNAVLNTSFPGVEKFILQWPWLIGIVLGGILFMSMIRAYVISNNMVGAFGRIIHELDEIIAGGAQKSIHSRPDDGLIKELLKRINVLIPYYTGDKDKK